MVPSYYFRVQARDYHYNLSPWSEGGPARVEDKPPVIWLEVIPELSRSNFAVWWVGDDVGGSGIESTHIQYRDTAIGLWTDWLTNTTNTANPFDGLSGHTYEFRSRARDKAGNVSAWPAEAEIWTTVASGTIRGQVSNNRGAPAADFSMAGLPPLLRYEFYPTPAAYSGLYDTPSVVYSLTVSSSSYNALPTIKLPGRGASILDIWFPPADNSVNNWGFELSSLSDQDWWTTGNYTPLLSTAFAHSGSQSILLGALPISDWMTETLLAPHAGLVEQIRSVTDNQGVIHAVWENLAGNYSLIYARRLTTGIWEGFEVIQQGQSTPPAPDLAIDTSGDLHLTWVKEDTNYNVVYATKPNGSTSWSNPTLMATLSDYYHRPHVVTNDHGSVYLVWDSGGETFFRVKDNLGTWTDTYPFGSQSSRKTVEQVIAGRNNDAHVLVFEAGALTLEYSRLTLAGEVSSERITLTGHLHPNVGLNIGRPAPILLDSSGNLVVVWGYGDGLCARRKSPEAIWTARVCQQSYGGSSEIYAAMDDEDVIHILWRTGGYHEIGYTSLSPNMQWQGITILDRAESILSMGYTATGIYIDQLGTMYATWIHGGSQTLTPYYSVKPEGGSWSQIRPLTNRYSHNHYLNFLELSPGRVHLLFQDPSGVYFFDPKLPDHAGNSTIQQRIDIPGSMVNPTLSYLTLEYDAKEGLNDGLIAVSVQDALTTTRLLPGGRGEGIWNQRWVDLSPWSGQAITLTMSITQEVGMPWRYVFLDEVTLGSSYADAWIQATSLPQYALPGETIHLLIDYGNHSPVLTGTGSISLTLPADLQFVAASPAPSGQNNQELSWDIAELPTSNLPATIVLTATISTSSPAFTQLEIPVSIGITQPEIELANNAVDVSVYLWRSLYMPMVAR